MNGARAIFPFPDRKGYTVSRGERHGLVMIIQIMLEALSLYYDSLGPFFISGTYDLMTENAVKAFQRVNKLAESGKVDLETWNRMAEEFNSVLKDNQ